MALASSGASQSSSASSCSSSSSGRGPSFLGGDPWRIDGEVVWDPPLKFSFASDVNLPARVGDLVAMVAPLERRHHRVARRLPVLAGAVHLARGSHRIRPRARRSASPVGGPSCTSGSSSERSRLRHRQPDDPHRGARADDRVLRRPDHDERRDHRHVSELLPGHDRDAARPSIARSPLAGADALLRGEPAGSALEVRMPASLPYLFTALKITATASIVGAIVGEGPGASATASVGRSCSSASSTRSLREAVGGDPRRPPFLHPLLARSPRSPSCAPCALAGGIRGMSQGERGAGPSSGSRTSARRSPTGGTSYGALKRDRPRHSARRVLSPIGPSGCGKSTLLRRDRRPDAAHERGGRGERQVRRPGTPGPRLRDGVPGPGAVRLAHGGGERPTAARAGSGRTRRPATQRARGDARPGRAGRLRNVATHYQLSGGMQQRVALARALAFSPACCSWTSRSARSTSRPASG